MDGAATGATLALPEPLASFTSGSVVAIGEGYGSLDVEATGFKAFVQAALDNRESLDDFVSLVMFGGGAVDDRQRHYHSSLSATETQTGMKGAILYIDYTLPAAGQVCAERAESEPAVGSLGADVFMAVESQRVETFPSVKSFGGRTGCDD